MVLPIELFAFKVFASGAAGAMCMLAWHQLRDRPGYRPITPLAVAALFCTCIVIAIWV
jgi:hypothetical protein